MKVGLLTTWNTQCGIAEYSRALAASLQARADIELVVLGSRNYDERAVAEPEEYVMPCFDVEAWNRYGHHALDVERILERDLDVLHVQYQLMLYDQARLNELLERFHGVRVVTWHDNCLAPALDWQRFDIAFTHRPGVGPSGERIAFGIRDVAPLVRTFGLGRTREDVIAAICERNGWTLESAASSEATLAEHRWMPWRELHDWLRGADAIVLWYADNELAGSSQAARTAIATRRPVIVNDVRWFADLPERAGAFRKIPDDPTLLEAALRDQLQSDPTIAGSSWERIAEHHVRRYRGEPDGGLSATVAVPATADTPVPAGAGEGSIDIAEWVRGDLGHLQRAGDLTRLPLTSHRRLAGRAVAQTKQTVRRLLYPLPEVQTAVNQANARVVTFLMDQVAHQERRIVVLERSLAALRADTEHRRDERA